MQTNTIDRSDLRKVILQEYSQFAEGIRASEGVRVEGKFEKIMISGMGGSALPGNIFRVFLGSEWHSEGEKQLGVFQNRFYRLPHEAREECLNFVCSHSGNTEETIASLMQAIEEGLPVVGIASGGKIEEICVQHQIPFVKLPIPFANFQPRMATGHFVSAMYGVLVNSGLVRDDTQKLLAFGDEMRELIPTLEEPGKEIAKKLVGKTPVVFSDTRFKSLAMIWKIKINENAKTPAFWNYFPELNHNEMVGYTLPQAKFIAVMLRDPGDDPRNLKRYGITAKLLEKQGVETITLDIQGETVYNKVFSTLALGDWVSYSLALEYGIDPTPVDMVEDLKKLLKD